MNRVQFVLRKETAVFLAAMVAHINQRKILPDDDSSALEASGMLEEIEAAARAALDTEEEAA